MLTNDADFGRVVGLSIAGILIVIAILLRSLLAPLYMVATVLLNYGTTLGIATWLFLDVMKQGSMIYMIPLFIFVILVALGADYNIFLVSRIREEAQQRPIKDAVSHAIANTGGVITACGIILAGTFATLDNCAASGSIADWSRDCGRRADGHLYCQSTSCASSGYSRRAVELVAIQPVQKIG